MDTSAVDEKKLSTMAFTIREDERNCMVKKDPGKRVERTERQINRWNQQGTRLRIPCEGEGETVSFGIL